MSYLGKKVCLFGVLIYSFMCFPVILGLWKLRHNNLLSIFFVLSQFYKPVSSSSAICFFKLKSCSLFNLFFIEKLFHISDHPSCPSSYHCYNLLDMIRLEMHSIWDLWRHNGLVFSRMLSAVLLSIPPTVIPNICFLVLTATVIPTHSNPTFVLFWVFFVPNNWLRDYSCKLFAFVCLWKYFQEFRQCLSWHFSDPGTWWLLGNIWGLVVNGHGVTLALSRKLPRKYAKDI